MGEHRSRKRLSLACRPAWKCRTEILERDPSMRPVDQVREATEKPAASADD
jgi:hypothetical protein